MSDWHDDNHDRELAELRRRSEKRALETGLAMLDDAQTPATAKASIVRAFLTDAAARAADEQPTDVSEMSGEELIRWADQERRRIQRLQAVTIEAETVATAPGVFD